MVKITTFGKIDALTACEELKAPLVVLKEVGEDNKTKYIGFVPGIDMKNVISNSITECQNTLKERATSFIKRMIDKNVEFPFFPNKEEILKDFHDVVSVKFIKISKRK